MQNPSDLCLTTIKRDGQTADVIADGVPTQGARLWRKEKPLQKPLLLAPCVFTESLCSTYVEKFGRNVGCGREPTRLPDECFWRSDPTRGTRQWRRRARSIWICDIRSCSAWRWGQAASSPSDVSICDALFIVALVIVVSRPYWAKLEKDILHLPRCALGPRRRLALAGRLRRD